MSTAPRTFVFNFQKRFAPKVESGEKRQTIRAWRKDGKVPRPGDRARLYTGLRTRGARLLCDGIVTQCLPVTMDERQIAVDGFRLSLKEADQFARLDGFDDADAMLAWFRKTHGDGFEGLCVRWRTPGGTPADLTRMTTLSPTLTQPSAIARALSQQLAVDALREQGYQWFRVTAPADEPDRVYLEAWLNKPEKEGQLDREGATHV